jgi:hypothetical protein
VNTKNTGVYSVACVDIPKYFWTAKGFQGESKVMFLAPLLKSAIFDYFCRKRRQNQIHLLVKTSPLIICERKK